MHTYRDSLQLMRRFDTSIFSDETKLAFARATEALQCVIMESPVKEEAQDNYSCPSCNFIIPMNEIGNVAVHACQRCYQLIDVSQIKRSN